ncbi:MAG: methyltransferase domain-containing protein [Acidimicrobiales bacterium]
MSTDPEHLAAKAMLADVFSASAPSYDQVIDFFGPFGSALVAAADLPRGATVLDVACGRGACLYPALEAVGPEGRVLGVDLAAGMVEHLAAELAAAGVANAEVQVGDAEHLDLESSSIDAVTAGFVIFFCPDPDRVLAEMARVLRPRGVVALSIFDGDTPSKWLREVGAELFGPTDARPSEAFDRADVLEAALAHAGFTDVTGIDVIEPVRFSSLEQLEAWHRSHFARLLLEALTPEQLEVYRGRMAENLAPHRQADGSYLLSQRARITVARRR